MFRNHYITIAAWIIVYISLWLSRDIFRSADTQKIGPSAPLKKLLEDYGIKVVIYE